MADAWAAERAAAVTAVRRAAVVTRAVQRSLVTADTLEKRDKSPVTVADFASQAVVCATLAEAFPNLPVVGEENADELRNPANAALLANIVRHLSEIAEGVDEPSTLEAIDRGGFDPAVHDVERYWALDPIDGTKGFLRNEQYAIALALIEEGRVVLGALACPNLPSPDGTGVLAVATRGGGCFALPLGSGGDGEPDDAGRRLHVSDAADAASARFCESVESGHSDQNQSALIAQRLGMTQPAVRMDSQAKYATLARGEASIYLRLPTRVDYQEKIWDHAAGAIVVEEAGGLVTDVTGKPLDFSRGRTLSANSGVVATNGKLHAAVVSATRATLGV